MLDSWKYCIDNKGLEVYGWCIMTSHVHMLIGTNKDRLENIMRDMKRYTSERLRREIRNHPQESRREWILWLMERAGKKNSNNIIFLYETGQPAHTIKRRKAVTGLLWKKQKIIYIVVQRTISE